ncbi:hypothetical protein PG1C_13730 [Rugosibacter aromaticivorans]|uniref:Uncharacterized protein n=1 Tax=Rugosibacter aromaticivorans TaxID=1565605 RepID=A0A0C5J2C7_9PROT|nr:CoA transferase [Rugosibacter aromaticivorans]AJP49202.1 hypothetical protein PG1C_13730 [Rugosibacter aromaticivorans]TBR15585.1 MAG: hypothetical protein EPO43_03710 [Rugosibacter sp.]
MDFGLGDEQTMLCDNVCRFMRERVAPLVAAHEKRETFAWKLLPGPYATQLFTDLGAAVIKVERPLVWVMVAALYRPACLCQAIAENRVFV